MAETLFHMIKIAASQHPLHGLMGAVHRHLSDLLLCSDRAGNQAAIQVPAEPSGGFPSATASRTRLRARPESPRCRCTLESVCSRERQLNEFGPCPRFHWSGFKPKLKSLACILNSLFFGVSRARASGEFGKDGGPSLGFRIEFDQDTKLHGAS